MNTIYIGQLVETNIILGPTIKFFEGEVLNQLVTIINYFE